ncbi:MAG TPA: YIP1 family protein [Methanoregula sp.]|nr:YIP1 family protein [Methanoregula sp.]
MITSIFGKAKGFLLTPVETFRQSKDDELSAVFSYFIALLLFNAILSAAFAAIMIETLPALAMMTWGMSVPVAIFLMMLVGGFIATLVFGVWLHLWVYLFGGRRGIMQTINAVIYGSTPRLLFGWIPFIGFIFTLWSLALGILGVRELQEIDSLKATLAVALAVMIPVILLIVLAAYFMIANVTTTTVPVTMI